MVGFPYYNNIDQNNEIYISDIVVENSKYFIIGFIFAIMTSSTIACANDIAVPAPDGNVPTAARNAAQGAASIAGFSAALAIGGCLFLAGYCAGKLSTKAIDRALGF